MVFFGQRERQKRDDKIFDGKKINFKTPVLTKTTKNVG